MRDKERISINFVVFLARDPFIQEEVKNEKSREQVEALSYNRNNKYTVSLERAVKMAEFFVNGPALLEWQFETNGNSVTCPAKDTASRLKPCKNRI